MITVGHFYKTKNNFYYLRASGDKANLALLEKFLLSFTVSPKPEAQLIGVGGRLELPPIPYNSTATDMVNKSDDKTANDKTDFTRKALIYLRPSPPYTEGARRASVQGTVAIRCLLSSSGRVTSLELLKKLDPGLDKNALAAARKIYFLPAKKGGRLVSQWIQVEYEFHLF